jgi:hypothetical protein
VVLTDDMVVAFKAMKTANAWSQFKDDGRIARTWDSSDFARELRAAGWPKGVRPYNLKHTVAIARGESGADWEDIKDWFGHKDVKSTRIDTGHILARTKQTAPPTRAHRLETASPNCQPEMSHIGQAEIFRPILGQRGIAPIARVDERFEGFRGRTY